MPSTQVAEAFEKCKWLTVEDVMELTGSSRSMVYNMTRRKYNPLPSVKNGKSRRYPFDKVRWWMENQPK